MEWSTMASWCPKGSTDGEDMEAQVDNISFTKIKLIVEQEETFLIYSVPLGSGEGTWLRLHSHLHRLVRG